jgi:hypothetical protein
MAGNQVTLTFAGETKNIEDSFGRVGAGAKGMSDKVGQAGKGFDDFGEKIGDQERRWQGLRSSITGTTDVAGGAAAIMKGDLLGGSVLVAGGLADLAQGFADTLVPLAKVVATTIAHTAAMVGHAVATTAVSAATKIWAGVQWLLNAALLANPIVLIVAGIVLLIGVIILIAKKTDWFSKAWGAAWGWIKKAASNVWDWLKKVPGWIGTAFSKVADFITAPFKAAFNFIARAWNATVGGLSFTVPSWIPGIGGKGFSMPHIPTFHAGGVVPGVPGTPTVALLQAGERVGSVASSGSGGEQWVRVDLGDLGDALLQPIAKAVSRRGGQVTHLGVRVVNGQVRA